MLKCLSNYSRGHNKKKIKNKKVNKVVGPDATSQLSKVSILIAHNEIPKGLDFGIILLIRLLSRSGWNVEMTTSTMKNTMHIFTKLNARTLYFVITYGLVTQISIAASNKPHLV